MSVTYDPEPVAAAAPRRGRKRRRYPDGSLMDRLQRIRRSGHPWYDWGHRVMFLVGQYRHGDYGVPRGRDLYYYPTSRRTFFTTYDWSEARLYFGLDRGWKVFDVQDDGWTVVVGWYPEDGGHISPAELSRAELKLFRRWDFWECRVRAEWFGFRRWLYHRALHAAVHQKRPFACNATPPQGAGGYSHWHCEIRGRHDVHRFRNYTWPRSTSSGSSEAGR